MCSVNGRQDQQSEQTPRTALKCFERKASGLGAFLPVDKVGILRILKTSAPPKRVPLRKPVCNRKPYTPFNLGKQAKAKRIRKHIRQRDLRTIGGQGLAGAASIGWWGVGGAQLGD